MAKTHVDGLTLYATRWCPFCIRVFRVLDRLGLEVDVADPTRDSAARDALWQARGRGTVPVLRIERPDGEVEWMPESADIVAWLRAHHG